MTLSLKYILSEILLKESAEADYYRSLPQRLDRKIVMTQDSHDLKTGGKIQSLKQKRDSAAEKYYAALGSGKFSKEQLTKLKSKILDVSNSIQKKIDSEREKVHNELLKSDKSYKEDYDDQSKFDKLNEKITEAGMDINKLSPEEQSEYRRLSFKTSPIFLTKRPGGVLQITTVALGENNGKILAQEYQNKIKEFVKSNFEGGKPKGVILDNRLNIGGSQDAAKGLVDFFVDGDEYPIETQKYNYGVRRFDTLQQYKETEWDDAVMKKLNSMSESEQQKYWYESKKKGYFEIENIYKSALKKEDKFLDIPVVVQTSSKTFSAGEFLSDTVKNLNPNTIQIGNNSGGGANQTFMGTTIQQFEDSPKLTQTQNAKNAADGFRYAFHDAEQGKSIYAAILNKINTGAINDKMSMEDMAKVVQDTAFEIAKDPHIDSKVEDGKYFVGVPQVRSDRVVVDKKTKKPIKDSEGNYQFNGNWEGRGIAAGETSPFYEVDANVATKASLEYIYDQTGNIKLKEELKSNPEKFGITKDGKDGKFDDTEEQHQNWFISPEAGLSDHSIQMHQKTKKNGLKNKDNKNVSSSIETIKKQFIEKTTTKRPDAKNINKLTNLLPKKSKDTETDKVKKNILNKTIKNPETGKDIKVSSALTYDRDSKAYKTAKDFLSKNI